MRLGKKECLLPEKGGGFYGGAAEAGASVAESEGDVSPSANGAARFKQSIMGLSGGGPAGALIFLLTGGFLMAMGIPRIWISAAAGAVFGLWPGFALAMAATLLGAAGTYGIGRGILGEVVERRLGARLTVWKLRFRENAFWWVLYGRLFPFSNSTLKSLLCGSCRVPLRPYLAATFFGFLPLTIVFNAFGSGTVRGSGLQIAIGFGAIALTMAARGAVERIRSMHFRPGSHGR